MIKKRLHLTFTIFLLLFCLFISDKQIINAQEIEITSLQTSYYEPNNFDLVLKNGCLYVEDVPDSFSNSKLWFMLYSESKEQEVWDNIFGPNNGSIIIPLSGLEDGIYRLYLYTNDSGDNLYYGYWWDAGAPKIEKSNNKYRFKLGEYYEEIREVHNIMATFDYVLDYYKKPSYWIESDDETIRNKALEITKDCSSDYEKIRQVYEWVINNIYYDYDALNTGNAVVNAVNVLKDRKSVCQGYAVLMAALLRSLDIPVMVVGGYGGSPINISDRNHAWNMAYADGRWIFIDATWDSHNQYKNGTFNSNPPNKNRMWFDMSLEMLAYSHYCMDEPLISAILDVLGEDEHDIDLTYGPVTVELKNIELPTGWRLEYKVTEGEDLCKLSSGKIKFIKTGSSNGVVLEVNLITDKGSETLKEIYYYLDNYCDLQSQKLSSRLLKKGDSYTFYIPDLEYVDDSVKYAITYKSSDSKVASVNKKGVVKAKGKGKCTITGIVTVGSNEYTFKQTVTVK